MKTKLLLFAMCLLAAYNMKAQSPCNAGFTYTISPSGVVTFYSTSTTINSAQLFSWNFGNGTTGYGTQVTCVYNTVGPFTACLMVTDSSFLTGPCSDSSCQTLTIPSGSGCNANFSIIPDTAAGPGNYIGFNWSTGSGLAYTWVWGDGSANSSGAYPSHTYATPGTYTICLVVMGSGCVDSFCLTQLLKTESMVTINFQASPSGLNDVKKEEASLYPNPADYKLFIKGDKVSVYQVDIYNLNGSKVLSTTAKGNHAINIAELPVNLYMVKITDASGKSEFAKFMKQ